MATLGELLFFIVSQQQVRLRKPFVQFVTWAAIGNLDQIVQQRLRTLKLESCLPFWSALHLIGCNAGGFSKTAVGWFKEGQKCYCSMLKAMTNSDSYTNALRDSMMLVFMGCC